MVSAVVRSLRHKDRRLGLGENNMKKRVLSLFLAAALSAAMLMGCGSGTGETKAAGNKTAGAETADTGEKVLRIAFPDTMTTVDIADVTAATMLKEVAGVCETLVYADSDFTLQPWLATEWEMTGDYTWKFKLREDVTFHDGMPMNAEAVKWSFDWVIAHNSALAGSTYIESVKVVDDYTVEFTTSKKTTDLPAALSYVGTSVVAPSSVDENGHFVRAVGTGYFMQDAFDEVSGTFECVAYDGYWQPVETNVTRRVVRSITDANARSLAVQSGEIDVASDIPFSDLETLANSENIQVSKFNTARTYFYEYNMKKDMFKDERVRKALIYAINKEEIVNDVLFGVGGVPKGMLMDDMPWTNTEVETYDYNVDKARELLAESGYTDSDNDGYLDKDGEKMTLKILTFTKRPGCQLIVQATQGYFANIGIDTSVEVLDWTAMNELIKAGEFDMALNSAASAYIPTPAYYMDTYYRNNDIGYINEAIDTLLDKCEATTDLEEKYQYSREAQALAQEDAAIFTPALYGAVFALSDRVTNFRYNAAAHDFIVHYETALE